MPITTLDDNRILMSLKPRPHSDVIHRRYQPVISCFYCRYADMYGLRRESVVLVHSVRIYSAETGAEVAVAHTGLTRHQRVTAAAFSPDGERILTAWSRKRPRRYSVPRMASPFELSGHRAEIVRQTSP